MSKHLDDIIAKHHGATNVMVVFLDVIKYSMRKSVMQQRIITAFNEVLQQSCDEMSRHYAPDAQKMDVNFLNDIIKIPTGDGAAIVFAFDGLQNIHLHFAISFLDFAVSKRQNVECPIFSEHGWCNCHNFFDVRIGISDGKGIVFKDINSNYNFAGNPINFASRVMGLGDRRQILLTEEAYKNMIDMTEDTALENKFTAHGQMEVKHDVTLGIYQYIGAEADKKFLNTSSPILVNIQQQIKSLRENPIFKSIAIPSNQSEYLQQAEKMSELVEVLASSKGELSGFKQLWEFITSGKPEDMEKFREFVATNSRLMELRKTMFKEEG
jgi:class 3 adenylate cyclase